MESAPPDTADTFVVAVLTCDGPCGALPIARAKLCSGVLLAPNLVVTARHCVAVVLGADGMANDRAQDADQVACGDARFGTWRTLDHIAVFTDAVVRSEGPFVRPVELTAPDDDVVCGSDVAAMLLASPLAAAPVAPNLAERVAPGDVFLAIGYGARAPGTSAGRRLRRDGLRVVCRGAGCATTASGAPPFVANSEWMGNAGPCAGDSGGGAFDTTGRLTGILSRGGDADCGAPVYAQIDANAAWLRSVARRAAAVGAFPLPIWAFDN
ncbi:MAG TPA: trypsin-like serine protease [Polyangiaceae bacterium]|nr:trypsin-like serine protease [Polyangiaceae bacterium]